MDQIANTSLRNTRSERYKSTGFSLIELLIVVAIGIMLMSLATPAINSVTMGSSLNRGGQLVSDQIALARQEAVAKNCDVQVRFFTINSGPNTGIRGIQLYRVGEGTNPPTPIGRMALLPDGIIVSSNTTVSPMLALGTNAGGVSGSTNLPAYGTLQYGGIRIRANGTLDSSVGSENYVTLQAATANGNPPDNYYTIQINPVTGKTIIYRP